jgi:hypothetical protein
MVEMNNLDETATLKSRLVVFSPGIPQTVIRSDREFSTAKLFDL